jgi:hypothetical protein
MYHGGVESQEKVKEIKAAIKRGYYGFGPFGPARYRAFTILSIRNMTAKIGPAVQTIRVSVIPISLWIS